MSESGLPGRELVKGGRPPMGHCYLLCSLPFSPLCWFPPSIRSILPLSVIIHQHRLRNTLISDCVCVCVCVCVCEYGLKCRNVRFSFRCCAQSEQKLQTERFVHFSVIFTHYLAYMKAAPLLLDTFRKKKIVCTRYTLSAEGWNNSVIKTDIYVN